MATYIQIWDASEHVSHTYVNSFTTIIVKFINNYVPPTRTVVVNMDSVIMWVKTKSKTYIASTLDPFLHSWIVQLMQLRSGTTQ